MQVCGAGIREGGGCGARGGAAGEGSEEHVAPGRPYCAQHPARSPQAHHHAGHHQMKLIRNMRRVRKLNTSR